MDGADTAMVVEAADAVTRDATATTAGLDAVATAQGRRRPRGRPRKSALENKSSKSAGETLGVGIAVKKSTSKALPSASGSWV